MIAIVSDIHNNIEALNAVMARCEQLGVKHYFCLGDIIGYGPKPIEVTKIAMKYFDICLMGNHEEAMINGKHRFNPYAAQAIDWTRAEVKAHSSGLIGKNNLIGWFKKRKPFELRNKQLMVHGSIYDPVHDYVDEPENPIEAQQMIDTLQRDFTGFDLCFAGHNHTPFLSTKVGTFFPHDGHCEFTIPDGHKAYICVGSVGQPRDRDNRASFATVQTNKITFHRVTYDVKKTQQQILDIGLHKFLAERLALGI